MGIKNNIRKTIIISFWLLVGAGIIVLLAAAVNSRTHQVCKGYDITINGPEKGNWFIDKKDILNVITGKGSESLKNKPVKSIDLNSIETKLRKQVWVKDAELYFDNNNVLKVNVTEREPIARVFTSTGSSFYIDSTCKKLPLSGKVAAKLPVFTSYPYANKKTTAGEKKLLKEIKDLGIYLKGDPFWMAQVSQVDITPRREFEIVPTVGNHVVEIGDAKDAKEKFQRLLVFYKQVLSKTGMEKYDRIKVQYNAQVIGVKKATNN